MSSRKHKVLTILVIPLLLQAWADVWVDAVTQTHYWHAGRHQYEHMPPDVRGDDQNGTPDNSLSILLLPWAEDPCPVPGFLHMSATKTGGTFVYTHSPLHGAVFTFPPVCTTMQGVLLYAPKTSPPIR